MQRSIVLPLTIAFAVLLVVLVLPTTPYAMAGTDIVRIFPDGDFVAAGWSDSGCQTDASRWDELDEYPQDGDTTCRTDSASNALQLTMQDPTPPAGTITNIAVQLFATIRVVSGSPLFDVDLISAGCETLNAIVDNQPGSVFVTVSATANDTRCGVEWTQGDLNALRISPFCQNIGQCSITNTYVDITYESESPPSEPPVVDPPPDPDDPLGIAKVRCEITVWSWPRQVRCTATDLMPNALILERLWKIDGKAVKRELNVTEGRHMEYDIHGLEGFPLIPVNLTYRVTYIIRTLNGDLESIKTVRLDIMRLWALYGVVTILFAFAYAYTKGRRMPYPEPEVSPP